MIRDDCLWYLRQGHEDLCRRDTFSNPEAPLKHLMLGCDCDLAASYSPVPSKQEERQKDGPEGPRRT